MLTANEAAINALNFYKLDPIVNQDLYLDVEDLTSVIYDYSSKGAIEIQIARSIIRSEFNILKLQLSVLGYKVETDLDQNYYKISWT